MLIVSITGDSRRSLIKLGCTTVLCQRAAALTARALVICALLMFPLLCFADIIR